MSPRVDPAPAESKRLQRCINDLISLLALPAVWSSGGDPSHIIRTLINALLGMLHLDFIYVRVPDSLSAVPIEMVRAERSQKLSARLEEVGNTLRQWLDQELPKWPRSVKDPFGDDDISILPLKFGLTGDLGLIVAGSRRIEFPDQTERLVLEVAANQAAIGLQGARRLAEQKRLAADLDERVAQRTAELALANEALMREIAERRLAEEARDKVRSELAHVSRVVSLGALTASIAHEINQPLASIITNGETSLRWLRRPEPDLEKVQTFTKRVLDDAQRAAEIIDRIRTMAARGTSTRSLIALDEVIRDSTAFLEHEFQSKAVSLSLDLASNLPMVFGDRTQLQQVIVNLAINAVQAITTSQVLRKSIGIRAQQIDAETVSCIIEDSGPGIDASHLPYLFDSFFTSKETGMGLGLPIAQSIIEAHNGRIRADNNSTIGGARFVFELPTALRFSA
jgi:signal transduction histidine kinase